MNVNLSLGRGAISLPGAVQMKEQPGYQIPCTQRVYEGSGQGLGHFPARHHQAAGSKVQGPQGPGGAGSGLAPASPPAPFMAGSGNGRSVLRRQ